MERKISSNFTVLYQIAGIVNLISLTFVSILTCFFSSDIKTSLIFIIIWVLALLLIRQIGLLKLKVVYQKEGLILVRHQKKLIEIPLDSIINIKKTFVLDDFPYVFNLNESRAIKKIYFIPKGNFLQSFFGENEIVAELRKNIKTYKKG